MRPQATDDVAPRGQARLDLAPAAVAAGRLGIYGGSFDPPHEGHLFVAEEARRAFALDHVVFVPARRPPHKPGRRLAPDGDRLAMLALLLGARPWASSWAGELRRAGPSYTVDTLEAFRSGLGPQPALHLLLGSDNLPGLPSWHRAEELLGLAQPIVVHRRDQPLDPAVLGALPAPLAERVRAGFLQLEPYEASSTAIRTALAAGRDPGPALPGRVRRYVALRGLYSAAGG